MGAMFWFVVLAAGAGGYYAFRRLQTLEEDIRGELAERDRAREPKSAPPPEPPEPAPQDGSVSSREEPLEERLLALVRAQPGRLQSELYGEVPEFDRRQVQDVLLRLDRAGRLRRVREKNTFELFLS